MSLAKCTATGNNLISTESTQIFIGGCNGEIGGHGNSRVRERFQKPNFINLTKNEIVKVAEHSF